MIYWLLFFPSSRAMLQRYLFLFLLVIVTGGQNRHLVLQQGFGVQKGRQTRRVPQLGSRVPRADGGSGGLGAAGGAWRGLHQHLLAGARGGQGRPLPAELLAWPSPGEASICPDKTEMPGRARTGTFSAGTRKALRAFSFRKYSQH